MSYHGEISQLTRFWSAHAPGKGDQRRYSTKTGWSHLLEHWVIILPVLPEPLEASFGIWDMPLLWNWRPSLATFKSWGLFGTNRLSAFAVWPTADHNQSHDSREPKLQTADAATLHLDKKTTRLFWGVKCPSWYSKFMLCLSSICYAPDEWHQGPVRRTMETLSQLQLPACWMASAPKKSPILPPLACGQLCLYKKYTNRPEWIFHMQTRTQRERESKRIDIWISICIYFFVRACSWAYKCMCMRACIYKCIEFLYTCNQNSKNATELV